MTDSKISVNESVVRDLIKELFYGEAPAVNHELPLSDDPFAPIKAQSTVDTSYRAFDNIYSIPVGTELVPKDKRELEAVIKTFLQDVPDTDVPKLYVKVQRAFDDVAAETDGGEGADFVAKKTDDKSPLSKSVEESIRRAVRSMIAEAPQMMTALNHSGHDAYGEGEDEPMKRRREMNMADKSDASKVTYPQLLKRKHDLKMSAKTPEERAAANAELGGLETREMSHGEMAPFTGHALPQGVKNEEWKTVQKAKFVAEMSPAQRATIVGNARKSYVAYLSASGELDDEEMALLKSHPAAVEELEGFRDWLDAYIMDAMEDKPGAEKNKRRQILQWKAAMRDIKQVNPSALEDEK